MGFVLRDNNACFSDFYVAMLGSRGEFGGLRLGADSVCGPAAAGSLGGREVVRLSTCLWSSN